MRASSVSTGAGFRVVAESGRSAGTPDQDAADVSLGIDQQRERQFVDVVRARHRLLRVDERRCTQVHRSATAAARSAPSRLTPSTGVPELSPSASSAATDSRQGPHQLAQKCRTTGSPRYSDRRTLWPSTSFRAKSGAMEFSAGGAANAGTPAVTAIAATIHVRTTRCGAIESSVLRCTWQPRCHGNVPKTGGFASPPFGGFAFFSRPHRCLRLPSCQISGRNGCQTLALRHISPRQSHRFPIAGARAPPNRRSGRRCRR